MTNFKLIILLFLNLKAGETLSKMLPDEETMRECERQRKEESAKRDAERAENQRKWEEDRPRREAEQAEKEAERQRRNAEEWEKTNEILKQISTYQEWDSWFSSRR